jgi:hypothetical protein
MKRVYQLAIVAMMLIGVFGCGENKADSSVLDKTGFLPAKPKPPVVEKTTLPEGTRLRVALIDGVSTTKSSPGDQFMASVSEPVVIDGKTVIQKGTKVRGRVTDVAESGRVKGRASIRLVLTDIVQGGKELPIATKPFIAVAENTKKRDAVMIGGGTGVGALIGGIAGGGKGAAIGAAVGGGAGTGTVLATKGKDLHYPPETKITFTLMNSVEM